MVSNKIISCIYFIIQILSCAIFIPVDVVKERLQVQSTKNLGYQYKGSWDALRTIFAQEGYRGWYKGYFATLFSYGPFSAVYFGIFEEVSTLNLLRRIRAPTSL